ncbi:MAG TPA: hypothetical protein VH590_21200 [Ktedonobacterales bacterium]|jgi:hypothetical protein
MIEEIWEESSYAEAVRDHTKKQMTERMQRMAQIALEKRFGPLSHEVLAAIKTANETTLEAVVGSNTLEEVRARLGLS